jgi:hypothetical protein
MLVAGGGYNTDHIIVEKIEIKRAWAENCYSLLRKI